MRGHMNLWRDSLDNVDVADGQGCSPIWFGPDTNSHAFANQVSQFGNRPVYCCNGPSIGKWAQFVS